MVVVGCGLVVVVVVNTCDAHRVKRTKVPTTETHSTLYRGLTKRRNNYVLEWCDRLTDRRWHKVCLSRNKKRADDW
jgi:hypothetical protein